MKINTKKLIIILGGLFLAVVLNAQSANEIKIPKNLEEAISELDRMLSAESKNEIINKTEDEFAASSHFGIGTWMRNNWGLWKGGELADYFINLEIYNPEDMSGLILDWYYRHLQNPNLTAEEQVADYLKARREAQEYRARIETDAAFARQELIKHQNYLQEENEKLQQEFPIGTIVDIAVIASKYHNLRYVYGEIIDWKTCVSKSWHHLYSQNYEHEFEYLEVKVKIIEMMDKKEKRKIDRYNHVKNNEFWTRAIPRLMRKVTIREP